MDWQTHSQPNYRFGVVTGYTCDIPAEDWDKIAKQLPILWQKLCDAMIQHHGSHPAEEWEAFLCMVRPDGGTIHIAPVRLPWKAHTDRTWVMVRIPLMEQEWFDLPDADADAAGFERAHDAIMRRVFNAIRQSATSPQARKSLRKLWLQHPFVVYGIQYDDKETMTDLRISGEDAHDLSRSS